MMSGKSGNGDGVKGGGFHIEAEARRHHMLFDFRFNWKGVRVSFLFRAHRLALAKRTNPKTEGRMSNIVERKQIFLDEGLSDKASVLDFVAARAADLGICDTAEALRADLEKREGEISTGLQDGFAIPHAKSAHVLTPSVVFVRTAEPIAWETLDGSDVRCVFALLVPESDAGSTHLRLISKLATHLLDKEFKDRITTARDPEELTEFILRSIA